MRLVPSHGCPARCLGLAAMESSLCPSASPFDHTLSHTPHACRIRDLNDEINKLMREKVHWERRIVELGGPDYSKTGPRVTDSEGRVMAETSGRGAGYRYFGAAKNLPGVKELFEKETPRQVGRWVVARGRAMGALQLGMQEIGLELVQVNHVSFMQARAERCCCRASCIGGIQIYSLLPADAS